jgi:hypothetical protein
MLKANVSLNLVQIQNSEFDPPQIPEVRDDYRCFVYNLILSGRHEKSTSRED